MWSVLPLQVNLCKKLLFLHELTQNMTTDCSLFMKIVSSEYLRNMLCTQIVVFVFFWHLVCNMICRCCELLKKDLPVLRFCLTQVHCNGNSFWQIPNFCKLAQGWKEKFWTLLIFDFWIYISLLLSLYPWCLSQNFQLVG